MKTVCWSLLSFIAACNGMSLPESCHTATPESEERNSAPTVMAADSAVPPLPADTTLYAPLAPFARVAMTGDIMLGTTFPDSVSLTHLPEHEGEQLFMHVAPILQEVDAAFGNLETNLLDSGGNIKKCQNPATYYVFRTPTQYARLLKRAGFDALSIANNHTNDLGEEGRSSTRQTLKRTSLAYAGHSHVAESAVFDRNGITFGFCAFSVSPLTPDLRDTTRVRQIIRSLRDKCQILVVSFHSGGEGHNYRHIPFDKEIYLGRDQGDVVQFAHDCIDHGADIIFGHRPHLPRAMELYKGHLVAYSLGNFCTPYRISLKNMQGYAPLLTADLDEEGHFMKGRIHPFLQQRGKGPLPDSLFLAVQEIRQLTENDFPHTPLTILPDGKIKVNRR